jgi:hypothetical protein
MKGVDYSYDAPDLRCLVSRGYEFVARYLSRGDSQKNITESEYQDLLRHGLSVVLVYQDGTSDMLKGSAEGRKDALAAESKAASIGWPRHRPIYFALDQDTAGFDADNWDACRNYLEAASHVLGVRRVGVYGSYAAIQILCPQYAPWGWQTYAWSRGRISKKAHFRQHKNGVTLCGGTVDLNETYKSDFGQFPMSIATEPSPIPPSQEDDDVKLIQNEKNGAVLIVSGSSAILCIDDDERKSLEGQGVDRHVVSANQFKRFETMRVDNQ